MTDGLTRRLAALAAEATEQWLSPAVREAASSAIADCIGGAIAGSTESVARIAAVHAAPGRATLWGTRRRLSTRDAALANGCAAHAHSIDDTHESMRGHPSAPVLPAVLALAEERGASGAEAMLAYVVGIEVAGRLGRAVNDRHAQVGWHTTCTLGTIGAAAGCARLLELDPSRATSALGIAASMASGLRVNFGSMTKALHAGLAAQNGVQAALLAQQGLGADPAALEGHEGFLDLFCGPGAHDAGRALAPADAPLQVLSPGIVLKLYPTCSLMHALVDMVLEARQRPGALDAPPEEILCRISPRLEQARGKHWPRSGLEARFHVPYCVATAWLHGTQDLADFGDAAVGRPEVRALAERVRLQVDESAPDGDYAELQVVLASGDRLANRQAKARGHPTQPLSPEARRAKFEALAQPVLAAEGTRLLWNALGELHLLPRVSNLSLLLQPAAEAAALRTPSLPGVLP
jgi:2-methylcitrate dehydratase PrpD